MFGILGFAFQMILILVTGHVFAHAPLIQRGLRAIVDRIATTPNSAVAVTFLVAALASWLNWGFGLVTGAVLAREVARRVRVDFGWLVAAAYSGWVVWASGPSSSIALSQASQGNALNIVEKLTGKLLPFSETVFTYFNLVPTLVIVLVMPVVFILLRPRAEDIEVFNPGEEAPTPSTAAAPTSFAQRANRSRIGSLFLVALGIAYLAMTWSTKGISLDVNSVILILFTAGVLLHGHPTAYVDAIKNAAKQTGSMMLQYPIYGGIMGIMDATGLAGTISKFFVVIANAHTLPFWTYFASLFITFLVPSGGGH
jgi:short-chain fatty acids transporter